MSRTFTTSDAHDGHELVAQLRGFVNAAEQRAHFDDWIRTTMSKRDTMWWLGDMTAGGGIHTMLEWIKSLPGTHHLVAGNHCPVHPMHISAHAKQRAYLEAFTSVQSIAKRRIGGRRVILSHFPVVGDHTEDPRHEAWRPRPFEGTLLHGHTHSDVKVSVAGETLQINVAPEAWGLRPVSDDELVAIIEDQTTPQPGCGCWACDEPIADFGGIKLRVRMTVCGTCGNKRCPAAADHRNACTGSNEPGQPGSLYA